MNADQLPLVLGIGVAIAAGGAVVACVGAALSWRGARAVNRTLRKLLGEEDDASAEERRRRAARQQ